MGLYRRDGILAVATLAAVLAAGLWTVGPGVFARPVAVGVGVGGAVVVEWLFLSYPDRLLALWERPVVAVASVAVLGGLLVVSWQVSPWLLGAVGWGLVTYLCLLGCLLVGLGNPVVRLRRWWMAR
jgi:hypothetical protein